MTAQTGRQARRQALVRAVLIAPIVIGFALGFGRGLLQHLEIVLPSGLVLAGGALLVLLAFAGAIFHWRNIDEAAREAHKFAWFWGGSSAMLLPLPVFLVLGETRLVALFGQQSPLHWVLIGVGSMLFPPMIGYGVVWAGWWLRQR